MSRFQIEDQQKRFEAERERKLETQKAEANAQLKRRHDAIVSSFKSNRQAYQEWDDQCKANHQASVKAFQQNRQHEKEFKQQREALKQHKEQVKQDAVRQDAVGSIAEVEHTLRRLGRDGSEEMPSPSKQNKMKQTQQQEKTNEQFIREIRERKEEDLRARKDRMTRQFRMESEQARLGEEIIRKRNEEDLLSRARTIARKEKESALAHRHKKITKAIHKDATNALALFNANRIETEAAVEENKKAEELTKKRVEDNAIFAEKQKAFEADRAEFDKVRKADIESFCRIAAEQVISLAMKVIDHNTDSLSDGTILYRQNLLPVSTWRQMTEHHFNAATMDATKMRLQRQAAREAKGRKRFALSNSALNSALLSTFSGTEGSEAFSQISGSAIGSPSTYLRKSVTQRTVGTASNYGGGAGGMSNYGGDEGDRGAVDPLNNTQWPGTTGAGKDSASGPADSEQGGPIDLAQAMMEEVERFLATTAAFDASQNLLFVDNAIRPQFAPPNQPAPSVIEKKDVFFVAGPALSGIDAWAANPKADAEKFETVTLASMEEKRAALVARAESREQAAAAAAAGKEKGGKGKKGAPVPASVDHPPEQPGASSSAANTPGTTGTIPTVAQLTGQTIIAHVKKTLQYEKELIDAEKQYQVEFAAWEQQMEEEGPEADIPEPQRVPPPPEPKKLLLVGFQKELLEVPSSPVPTTQQPPAPSQQQPGGSDGAEEAPLPPATPPPIVKKAFLQEMMEEVLLEPAAEEDGDENKIRYRIHSLFVHENLRTSVRRFQSCSATGKGTSKIQFYHPVARPAPPAGAQPLRPSFDEVYQLSHRGISETRAAADRLFDLYNVSSQCLENEFCPTDEASFNRLSTSIFSAVEAAMAGGVNHTPKDTTEQQTQERIGAAWSIPQRQQFISRLAVLYQSLRENEVRSSVFARRCVSELLSALGESYEGFDSTWTKPERWSFCDQQRERDVQRMTECVKRATKKSNSCRALNIVAISSILINNAQQIADIFFPPPVVSSALKNTTGGGVAAVGGGEVSEPGSPGPDAALGSGNQQEPAAETPRPGQNAEGQNLLVLNVQVPLPDLTAVENQLAEGEDSYSLAEETWNSIIDGVGKTVTSYLLDNPSAASHGFSNKDFQQVWSTLSPQLLQLALDELKTQVEALSTLIHCANTWSLRRYSECTNSARVIDAPTCSAELLAATGTKAPTSLAAGEKGSLTQFHMRHLISHINRACRGRFPTVSATNGSSGREVSVHQEEFVHGLLSAQVSLLGLYLDLDDIDEDADDYGDHHHRTGGAASEGGDESVFLPQWWARKSSEEEAEAERPSLPLFGAIHLEELFEKLPAVPNTSDEALVGAGLTIEEPQVSLTSFLVQFALGRRNTMGTKTSFKVSLAPIASARNFGAALSSGTELADEAALTALPFWFAPQTPAALAQSGATASGDGKNATASLKMASTSSAAAAPRIESEKAYQQLLKNLWCALSFSPCAGASHAPSVDVQSPLFSRTVTRNDVLRLVVAPDQTSLKSLEKVFSFHGEIQEQTAAAAGGSTTGAVDSTVSTNAKISPSVLIDLYQGLFKEEDFDVLLSGDLGAGLNTVTLSSSHWAKAMLKAIPSLANPPLPM